MRISIVESLNIACVEVESWIDTIAVRTVSPPWRLSRPKKPGMPGQQGFLFLFGVFGTDEWEVLEW